MPPGPHSSGGAEPLTASGAASPITANTFVSLTLVVALLCTSATGAMVYGRQAQRFDTMESALHEQREESKRLRSDVLALGREIQQLQLMIIERTPSPQRTGR